MVDYQAHTLAWKGRMPIPEWLLIAERVQQVVSLPDQPGWCEYRTWDSWKGPLAYVMQWMFKDWIAKNYEFWLHEEVKKYME